MKILLTGANGFVGSHLLDGFCSGGEHELVALLRRTSNTRFIASRLREVEVRYGSLSDKDSLRRALEGVQALVHCAGKTKAVHVEEYYEVNAEGTRRLVESANEFQDCLRHFIHVSSIAAVGPGTPERPSTEDDPPHPVSHYGRSKLLGEQYLSGLQDVPYTILRPTAVYGPRDSDFFSLFHLVKHRFAPLIGGLTQALNLIYVGDLSEAAARCVGNKKAFGKTFHLAHPEQCSSADLVAEIARAMDVHALRIQVPSPVISALCVWGEVWAHAGGRPGMLNMQKLRELRAPGWICSTERIKTELGFVPRVSLREGIRLTLAWYRNKGWL